jgi:hypothetical protein
MLLFITVVMILVTLHKDRTLDKTPTKYKTSKRVLSVEDKLKDTEGSINEI